MHTIPDWASRSMNEKRKKNEPPAQVQTNEKGIEDKPVFTLSIHNKMKKEKRKKKRMVPRLCAICHLADEISGPRGN